MQDQPGCTTNEVVDEQGSNTSSKAHIVLFVPCKAANFAQRIASTTTLVIKSHVVHEHD